MASTPGKAPNEVFDASKQAKAPPKFLANPPLDLPAVRMGLVTPRVGYGLFAARDLAAGEFVLHEAPLMTALFNETFSADASLTQGQVAACRAALLLATDAGAGADAGAVTVTAVAFPAIAARFGVGPVLFDDEFESESGGARGVMGKMGMNLVAGQGRFAGSTVTRDEYEAYTARLDVSAASGGLSETEAREACREFFRHYAFQVLPRGSGSGGGGCGCDSGGGRRSTLLATAAAATREACVYLLGSLVNHCCTPPTPFLGSASFCTSKGSSSGKHSSATGSSNTPAGPNCSWRIGPSGLAQFIKPRHICVQARRAIREGEQLTWDYGKRDKGFACECDTCRNGLMGGLGSLCGVL